MTTVVKSQLTDDQAAEIAKIASNIVAKSSTPITTAVGVFSLILDIAQQALALYFTATKNPLQPTAVEWVHLCTTIAKSTIDTLHTAKLIPDTLYATLGTGEVLVSELEP